MATSTRIEQEGRRHRLGRRLTTMGEVLAAGATLAVLAPGLLPGGTAVVLVAVLLLAFPVGLLLARAGRRRADHALARSGAESGPALLEACCDRPGMAPDDRDSRLAIVTTLAGALLVVCVVALVPRVVAAHTLGPPVAHADALNVHTHACVRCAPDVEVAFPDAYGRLVTARLAGVPPWARPSGTGLALVHDPARPRWVMAASDYDAGRRIRSLAWLGVAAAPLVACLARQSCRRRRQDRYRDGRPDTAISWVAFAGEWPGAFDVCWVDGVRLRWANTPQTRAVLAARVAADPTIGLTNAERTALAGPPPLADDRQPRERPASRQRDADADAGAERQR